MIYPKAWYTMGTKDTQTAIYCVFDDEKKVHNADTTGAQRVHNRAQRVHNGTQWDTKDG